MIKEKLLRIRELYQFYKLCENDLVWASGGSKANLRRRMVFLKEKMLASLRDIKNEMQPKLFVVYLTTSKGASKTVIMRAESRGDIPIFVELLQLINKELLTIEDIHELPTIFEGTVSITINPNK